MGPPMNLPSRVPAGTAIGRRVHSGFLAALVLAACADSVAAVEKGPPQASVRTLPGDDTRRVESLTKRIDQLKGAGRFAEAVEPAQQILAICQKGLGPDHWQAADARRTIDDLRAITALPDEGRKALASVGELARKAELKRVGGQYGEAERMDRTRLETCRRWLGDVHHDTAEGYNNLALSLHGQGKYAEADPLYRQALAIRLKTLGAGHPQSAGSYDNLADNLREQGRSAEAEPLLRTALAIRLKILGADHPTTAVSYHNLG